MAKINLNVEGAFIGDTPKINLNVEGAFIGDSIEKKNPSQKDTGLSGKSPFMATKKDEGGFWGALSDTFDIGLQRMGAAAISGGATFLTKVLTGTIKGAVGEEDVRGQNAIKPLIDTLEAPSEWLLQKANEFNEKSAPKLNEAAIKMGLKEENLDVPTNELLRKDVGQGFLKLGIASVTQLPQLISTVLAGESKLNQFLASASLATTQSIQEEYDKDKNVSGIDVAQSGLKGIVEGLTEMIFDTDLKTIRKTGAALVDVTYDGATSAIKNLIKSEGKKEAKEAIIRTWGGVVKEGLKGMGQEALEEGISSAAGFVIDTIDSGKLDGKDYEKLKDDFYDSMLIGGFMGGGISSIGAMASKQKLTKEQEHQVSKLQEVANDESLPTEAREVAASKIEDIKKYNFGLANDNYKLLANLPVDQRVEALNLTNRIENFEIAKSKSKTENLIAEFDLRIEDLEKKRDAIFNEYDASGAKAAAEAKKTQSDKDQGIANQFIDTNNIFGEVDNSLAPIQQRLNNNEQIDENELNKSADELYTIADRIHKDETLTPEQKNIILAPIEEQIQKLDTYELATKTTTTEITQTATTKGTREVGRVERQGGAKDVTNQRWAGIPVSVTSEDGTVTNTIAEVTPSGKVILKPKTSFNKKSQIRDAQTEVAKKPLVIDTNFTEFVESKFDEDGNVSGVVLKDNRNNTTFEVNDPVLALDIAIKEKQNKLGSVSDAIFEQVLSETPVGTKILQETKLAGRKAIPAPQVTAQTQVTPTANILGKLTPRQAVEVDSNIEQRTDNPILNTLGAQVKTVVSNAFKALKSVSPDSRMVIYDNEDSMIEGLVNEGVSREDAINSALGAGGLYNPSTGNIHINKGAKDASGNIVNTLTGGTIPHEITHAVLSKLAKENPAEFTEMINRILPFIPEPQRSKLQEFAGRYEQEGGDIQAEEFLAELASMITKGTVKFKTGHIHRIKLAIKDFIKKIADKYKSQSLAKFADNLFKNETSAQSDMKFFEDLARSIQSGQKINTARIDALIKNNKSVRTAAQVTPSVVLKAQKADVTKTPVAGNRLFNEPLADAKRIATEYMDKKGLKYEEGERITSVDKERAKRMSDAYMAMADNYNIPEVKASYDAMIQETIDQYKEIIANGYEVEINDTEPYKNAQEFIDDLRSNKHFKLLSTLSEFGDTPVTEEMANNDPRLKRTEFKDVNGQTLLANDLFRFVHDFFGHAVRGNSLGAIGEENAWDEHSRMYTPLARKAMTTETRGQNSYVNFSGVNDNAFKLRDIARKLRAEGRIEEANKLVNKVYEMMQFAPQKLGLLPDEFVLRDDEIKPTLRQQKLEKSEEIAKKTEDKTVSGFKQPSMILIGKVDKQEVTLYSGEASVNDLKEVKPIMYVNRAKTLFDSHLVSKKTKDLPKGASKQEVMAWADKIYKEAKNNVISNLLFIYDNIPSNIRDISKLWYDGANIIAQKFSEKYNLSLEQTAAVIATQSPQKPWFDNVHLAHYIIDFYSNNQDSLFTQEAYDYYKNKSIKDDGEPYVAQVAYLPTLQKSIGKKFSELNKYDKSAMIRYSFDNFADRKAPLRIPTGIIVSKVDSTSSFSGYDTIAKAVSIIKDGSNQNISNKLGDAFKVRNFYNNIVTPQTDNEVTIDTHAIAASYLLPLGSKSKEVKFDEATYAFFADAYREAAKQRGVLAREMQSITWEGARSIFPSEEKTDTNKTEARGIWQEYKSGKATIEEVQQKIKENGKNLSETDWGQYINQLSKEGSDSDYIGELPVVSRVQQTTPSRGTSRSVSGVSRVGDGGRKNGLRQQKTEDIAVDKAIAKESNKLKAQIVWQGSPYSFNKFNTDKIGTGTGSLFGGWGLYFTIKKERAVYYANKLKNQDIELGDIKIDKEDYRYGELIEIFKKTNSIIGIAKGLITLSKEARTNAIRVRDSDFEGKYEQAEKEYAKASFDRLDGIDVENANKIIKRFEDRIERLENGLMGDYDYKSYKYRDFARKVLSKGAKLNDVPSYLYEVSIADDLNLLDFDKKISPDIYDRILTQAIKENSKFLPAIIKEKESKGRDFYFNVSQAPDWYDNDKELSMLMLNAGIDGNIMNSENTRDIILFNSEAAKIVNKLRQQKTEQKVPNATAASKKAFEQKRKFDISKFPRDLQKWLLDRQVNIRKALRDAEMEFTMYALVNKAGATPLANYKFQGIYKAIYDGMTKEEIDRLDDFIFLRRVIAIDSNFDNQRDQLNKKIRDLVELKKIAKTKEELSSLNEEIKALHEKVKEKERPEHPEHLDSNGNSVPTNKESAEQTLNSYKQSLGEDTYNKMYDKSNQYFNAFTDLLKYKFDNGLITKEEYDMYKDYNYSPRKFFNHVFGNTDASIYTTRGVSLNQDEIKGIQDGSLDYLETNSMKLLHSAMVATENKVMTNKALRTFFQEAAGKNLPFFKELNYERRKDGSIVTNKDGSLAYKGASAGFTNMIFKVDGINQGFQLDSELAKEFLDVEKWNSNHKAYKLLSNASGAQVLRQMATGLNVGFFISNIPIDLLSQVHFNDVYNGGGVGVAGQYQKAITGTLSTVKSLIVNDPEIQKLVLEYAQAGGLMMTQSQEGTSQAVVLGKVENALSYLGNMSEMASKLNAYKSVKERETAKYAEENNGAKPDAAAQEKINARAAFEARGAMDFHRGGLLTKYLDGFIPYLNVAFQGARITADYIYKNPVKFTNKIIQTGLGVMALTLYNMMVAGDEWDNDDLQQAKAGKLLVFSPFKNADGTHSYTEIPVPTGVKAFWNLFQNMGEGIYYKHIVNKPEKLNGALAKTLADDLAMMMPKVTTMMPPTFKAIYEYSNNKNLWTNRNITYEVVKTKDEGRFEENVLGIYKIMGKVMDAMGMDLSPIKTQKAVEDVITNPHTDIAIGLAYSMLDKFVNLIPEKFGGLSEKEKSKYSKQTVGDFAVQPIADLLSRATGTTDKKNNGKYLNIQEIIDKENKEVGSYRQEIKYDVQKMAEDKVPMKNALNYITSIGSVGDKKFAANYYKALTEQSYLSIPSNKFRYGAIAFGATTDEARAKVLYASFPNFNVIQNDEVMKDLKLMGIATPMTMMYYKEIYANKGVLKSRL